MARFAILLYLNKYLQQGLKNTLQSGRNIGKVSTVLTKAILSG